MLRAGFHAALEDSRRLTIEMAQVTLSVLNHACAALERSDLPAVAQAILSDDTANDHQARIEAACTEMLWKQQPLASEFRQIAATLDLASELQRAAHNASAVAKRVAKVQHAKVLGKIPALAELAALAQSMLGDLVTALERGDHDLVHQLSKFDDDVERLYAAGIKALQEYMQAHPASIGDGTQLLFALASLRRVCKRTRSAQAQVHELIA